MPIKTIDIVDCIARGGRDKLETTGRYRFIIQIQYLNVFFFSKPPDCAFADINVFSHSVIDDYDDIRKIEACVSILIRKKRIKLFQFTRISVAFGFLNNSRGICFCFFNSDSSTAFYTSGNFLTNIGCALRDSS